jgi:ABC-2 type transport system ATP-binding protein
MDKVEQVEVNGAPALRLRVTDINAAKRELPAIVIASGLTLLRYELTLPSLEDIFIELVAGGGRQ